MTIPEILAALERFGGTARPTEPGLLVLTLPAETTRERLDEVVDAVCAMGLPADLRVGVTRAELHHLRRGTILRRARPSGSVEVGVVLGPSPLMPEGRVECAHGWIDTPPDVGLFSVGHDHLRRGIWQIASEEDAAIVRALFLAHAREWGPDSAAWAAADDGNGPWTSPPIASRWGAPPQTPTPSSDTLPR